MRQIVERQLNRVNRLLETGARRNDSFLGGGLGLIYYYFHFYKVSNEERFRRMGEELLDGVFVSLNSGYPKLAGPSFSGGGAGLGYVINALSQEGLVDIDIKDEFSELDQFLFNSASFQIEDDFIDYLHGALGVVHYFTARESTKVIDLYLDKLIGQLCDRVIKKESGFWFRNYVLHLEDKEVINFGLSHGLCGILLILLNAYERSDHKATIKNVVLEGIRFIRKYKMDVDFSNDEYSFFPFTINQGEDVITAPNRLGWCYGDLNEVLLFYRAGNLFKDRELVELAEVIGIQSLMRKDSGATMVEDSSFCHGASGLSQVYRKLYLETGNTAFKEGSEFWIEQTILFLDRDLENGLYSGREHELLDGLLGVAFALLSYISEHELSWSRSLLL